ncbi:hypothetical protein [Tsukamurella hominis]|uniref:hypothetical protein n=1 Tax=Tsukamurella hominis TaxID=1970232 RepID=UPI0039E8FB84
MAQTQYSAAQLSTAATTFEGDVAQVRTSMVAVEQELTVAIGLAGQFGNALRFANERWQQSCRSANQMFEEVSQHVRSAGIKLDAAEQANAAQATKMLSLLPGSMK